MDGRNAQNGHVLHGCSFAVMRRGLIFLPYAQTLRLSPVTTMVKNPFPLISLAVMPMLA
jgi:hypothetical protein